MKILLLFGKMMVCLVFDLLMVLIKFLIFGFMVCLLLIMWVILRDLNSFWILLLEVIVIIVVLNCGWLVGLVVGVDCCVGF